MHLFRLLAAAALAALAVLAPGCGTSCDTISVDVAALCLPDPVVSDQTAVIEVREACSQCTRPPACTAVLRSGSVVLDVHQEKCNDVSLAFCPSTACLQRVARCTLPSLPVGDYPLVVPGSSGRLLRVRATGQSSCQLPTNADGGV